MYHSVLLVYKVKANKQPRYLSNMYMGTYKYNTRIAHSGQIKLEGRPKLELTMGSFKWFQIEPFFQCTPHKIWCSRVIIPTKMAVNCRVQTITAEKY